MFGKIKIKDTLLLILIIVCAILIFRKPDTSEFENRIEELRQENEKLENDNVLLIEKINRRDEIIITNLNEINILEASQEELENIIEQLNERKDENNDYVNDLDSNGIVNEFTDYIKRRRQ